jgi:outer membrane lipoprotein-sorting protein
MKMIKKELVFLMFVFFAMEFFAQSGKDILKQMHNKYNKGPCKSYTFSQKNTHYKADTVSGHSEWHEAIEFPDKFRIDFGDKSAGNFVVFKNDSVFNYKAGKKIKERVDSSTLLLLLGGMYYRELADVYTRLVNAGYKIDEASSQKWNNEDVYVIGAKENDLNSNQFWVEKKTMRILRIIEKLNDKELMDMRFEAHQKSCNGYTETKVSFRRNGKLEQVEEYYNIKESSGFPK